MSDRRRGHRALPHTADVILEAWGPDLASCSEEAVAALVETFVATAMPVEIGEHRARFGPDSEEPLLLAVLEEVIFTLDTAEAVPVRAEAWPDGEHGLEVALHLADPAGLEPTGAVPKAVSRSSLEVDVRPERVFCRFLVDL